MSCSTRTATPRCCWRGSAARKEDHAKAVARLGLVAKAVARARRDRGLRRALAVPRRARDAPQGGAPLRRGLRRLLDGEAPAARSAGHLPARARGRAEAGARRGRAVRAADARGRHRPHRPGLGRRGRQRASSRRSSTRSSSGRPSSAGSRAGSGRGAGSRRAPRGAAPGGSSSRRPPRARRRRRPQGAHGAQPRSGAAESAAGSRPALARGWRERVKRPAPCRRTPRRPPPAPPRRSSRASKDGSPRCGSALVAFSAGVDSTFVLAVAREVLGDRAVALTAHSPSVPQAERDEARAPRGPDLGPAPRAGEPRAGRSAATSRTPRTAATTASASCTGSARRRREGRGSPRSSTGSTPTTGATYRPGHRAAQERAVRSPLAEAGLTKDEVRAWSAAYGLPTWDKPQMACLASRIPYGTAVTPERLAQVERAEAALRALGFRDLRVRHHGDIGRVELGEDELAARLRAARGDRRGGEGGGLQARGARSRAVPLGPDERARGRGAARA